MYTPEVIERFKNLKNAGELKKFNSREKTGDPYCSDVIEIKALFEEGKVKNVKFLVYGCPGEISTTDTFIDFAKGKTIEQALNTSQEEIFGLLGESFLYPICLAQKY